MGRDHPDGTLRTIKAEVVAAAVVNEIAANETAISKTEGKVTNTDQTYQTLATWTVTAARNGILYGVEFYASAFSKAHFQLTVAGAQQWTDVELPVAFNPHFADLRLAAGDVVLLEGKSNDGTSVNMWGHIEGKEVG
ncbi:MAG: hypothetical protein ACE5IZ_10385 [Dehalococcoidia bacterium]